MGEVTETISRNEWKNRTSVILTLSDDGFAPPSSIRRPSGFIGSLTDRREQEGGEIETGGKGEREVEARTEKIATRAVEREMYD